MISIKEQPPVKDVTDVLAKMREDLRSKAVRSALVQAIKPLKAQIKANAPVRTGSMREAVGHGSISKRAKQRLGIPDDRVALLVGTNRKVGGVKIQFEGNTITTGRRPVGRRALWVEFGTKYASAIPFQGNALDQTEGRMPELFYQGLRKHLAKLAKVG